MRKSDLFQLVLMAAAIMVMIAGVDCKAPDRKPAVAGAPGASLGCNRYRPGTREYARCEAHAIRLLTKYEKGAVTACDKRDDPVCAKLQTTEVDDANNDDHVWVTEGFCLFYKSENLGKCFTVTYRKYVPNPVWEFTKDMIKAAAAAALGYLAGKQALLFFIL